MWVFTKSGFLSAVSIKGRIVVRGRSRGHLESFRKRHKIRAAIHRRRFADYEWRMFVGRAAWARAMAEEASSIDYPNFKNAAREAYPLHLLPDIWTRVKDALECRG